LAYDVVAFDRLVSALWRWIRKTGQASGPGAYRPFAMPGTRRDTEASAP
jgi:hypothetical protein